MSTQENERPEKPCSFVRIENNFYDRVEAVVPAICRQTGLPRMSVTQAIHHLLDAALKTYEQR